MKHNIYLCGHTGSINRGCDAIVRSTLKLLSTTIESANFKLCSFNPEDDLQLGINQICNIVPYETIQPHSLRRYIGGIIYHITGNDIFRQRIYQKNIFNYANKNDLLMQIGGDTYCYDKPLTQYSANILSQKRNITNVLWSCSIEKINKEMKKDLLKYVHIFPRESLTYNMLKAIGIPEKKMTLMADCAFILDEKESSVSRILNFDNAIGINLSPLSMEVATIPDITYENVYQLINYILFETKFNIILIPHVYKTNYQDLIPLTKLYNEFKNTKRIQLVADTLTSEELKYIIGKCRLFIGARTHSTIAAYSSCVPTLTLGYSIKSKGIATDLFGTYKNFVLPVQDLRENNELVNAFKWLINNENQIKMHLQKEIPKYVQRVWQAGEKIGKLMEK